LESLDDTGCIHYSSERRTWDFPGYEDCDIESEAMDDWLAQCGPDCPGFEPALDEATARNI
jgi:hypothetical protein